MGDLDMVLEAGRKSVRLPAERKNHDIHILRNIVRPLMDQVGCQSRRVSRAHRARRTVVA
jgi:hypothetical protein